MIYDFGEKMHASPRGRPKKTWSDYEWAHRKRLSDVTIMDRRCYGL